MSTSEELPTRKKKKLGHYPSAGVVFGLILALLVVGLYGMLFTMSVQVKEQVTANVEMQVMLNRYISPAERNRLEQALAVKEYVARQEDGTPRVRLVTKEEAAEQFIAETGEDFMEFLGENPLHDALVINIAPTHQDTATMAAIQAELQKEPGVFEVSYPEGVVTWIGDNLMTLGFIAGGFALLLIVAVILLINNTIKLALFSQRFLIRSMQLVGAKPSFIQRPFMVRSLLQGVSAAVVVSVFLLALFYYAQSLLPQLAELEDIPQFLILFAALLVLGSVLSVLSTRRAMRKYLRMSLDDLY